MEGEGRGEKREREGNGRTGNERSPFLFGPVLGKIVDLPLCVDAVL